MQLLIVHIYTLTMPTPGPAQVTPARKTIAQRPRPTPKPKAVDRTGQMCGRCLQGTMERIRFQDTRLIPFWRCRTCRYVLYVHEAAAQTGRSLGLAFVCTPCSRPPMPMSTRAPLQAGVRNGRRRTKATARAAGNGNWSCVTPLCASCAPKSPRSIVPATFGPGACLYTEFEKRRCRRGVEP